MTKNETWFITFQDERLIVGEFQTREAADRHFIRATVSHFFQRVYLRACFHENYIKSTRKYPPSCVSLGDFVTTDRLTGNIVGFQKGKEISNIIVGEAIVDEKTTDITNVKVTDF